jgi:hypothetical protein
MASGQTLLQFAPAHASYPSSGMATPDTRNAHPVLDFDTTSQETVYFEGVMPRHYAGGGVTVYLTAALSSAVSGTLGWDVSFERLYDAGSTDVDSDSFATAQTVTATTVPGTSGVEMRTSVAVTNGANMDGITAGDHFRMRIRRDVANDTAAGDAELSMVEIVET